MCWRCRRALPLKKTLEVITSGYTTSTSDLGLMASGSTSLQNSGSPKRIRRRCQTGYRNWTNCAVQQVRSREVSTPRDWKLNSSQMDLIWPAARQYIDAVFLDWNSHCTGKTGDVGRMASTKSNRWLNDRLTTEIGSVTAMWYCYDYLFMWMNSHSLRIGIFHENNKSASFFLCPDR